MSQFLYHLPGVTKGSVSPGVLDDLGLGHLHGGHQPQCAQNVLGPEGVAGMLLSVAEPAAPAANAPRLSFDAARQTWRHAPLRGDKPAYSVGYWTDARPTAESLVRTKPLGGVSVRLLDGGDWRVPVAMAQNGLVSLPMVLDLDAAGNWGGRVSPQYRYLCDHARAAYEMLMRAYVGDDKTINFNQSMAVVSAALAANYRVGPVEIAALGLVGDDQIGDVLEAVCDWAVFLEGWLRQAGESPVPDSSPTSSGETAV